MRKVFTLTIAIFLLMGIITLLFFDKQVSDYISILTVKQSYQRLVTEGEELSITFFINDDESFVIEKEFIENAYLKSEDNELEVKINMIRNLEYEEEYLGITYYAYCFDLGISDINIYDYQLDIVNSYLVLEYVNGENINLEIGDIFLYFQEPTDNSMIDINRMFGLYQYADFEYIYGIYLDIEAFSDSVFIKNISILNRNIRFDLNNYLEMNQIPSYTAKAIDLFDCEYFPIGNVLDYETIELDNSNKFVFPIKYLNEIEIVYWFPIIIEYTYLGDDFVYCIDDFQFNNKALGLEVNSGRIREFKYYY